jgi:dsDNA-specific endonuclease/ATPase MutS2
MRPPFAAGDAVLTPFGKGVVVEPRNKGRLLVRVRGRALLVAESDVSAPDPVTRRRGDPPSFPPPPVPPPCAREPRPASPEVDLHGLTVAEALARVEQALSDALLAGLPELRLIHGRSGGRIRAALHRHLRGLAGVRGFRLDPRNEGVTIVTT